MGHCQHPAADVASLAPRAARLGGFDCRHGGGSNPLRTVHQQSDQCRPAGMVDRGERSSRHRGADCLAQPANPPLGVQPATHRRAIAIISERTVPARTNARSCRCAVDPESGRVCLACPRAGSARAAQRPHAFAQRSIRLLASNSTGCVGERQTLSAKDRCVLHRRIAGNFPGTSTAAHYHHVRVTGSRGGLLSIELVPLCTLHAQLKAPIVVGAGCAGTRRIVEVASIAVKGDRLSGEMVGAASADWIIIGPEGTATIDARVTLRTDDGAIIFTQYNGKLAADLLRGMKLPATGYVAPRFETSDQRYAWLNRIQAVGKGTINEDFSLDYEWYEVR